MLLVSFVLLVLVLTAYIKWEKEKVYFTAVLLFTAVIYVSNEVLSLFHRLDRQSLCLVYGTLSLGFMAALLLKLCKSGGRHTLFKKVQRQKITVWIREDKIRAWFLILFLGIFVLAFFTWPYNWDSMTYHLTRIAHWAQEKSVAHYAVEDVRQLASPVLAEFVNLHVYLFHRGEDNWLNLLQYGSFVTNAALVYFITDKLWQKKDKKIPWLSVLLFVSMPIAFGEALTTQVDHFSTLFLLLYVYFMLELLRPEHSLVLSKENIAYVIILSSCIGFGYLAKPSVMFAMVVFACWLLVVCIRRKDKGKDIMLMILMAAGLLLVILFPEVMRNMMTFQALSSKQVGNRQLVGTLHPLYLLINGMKNYAMNLPNIYLDLSELIVQGIYWIGYRLGVEVDAASIAEDGRTFGLNSVRAYGHDVAINPIVVIAATIVCIGFVVRKMKKEAWSFSDSYFAAAAASFGIFCVVLRWEPFVNRYLLSYLALLCPMAAVGVGKIRGQERKTAAASILIFVCCAELCGLFGHHYAISKEQRQKSHPIRRCFSVRAGEWEYLQLKEELEALGGGMLGIYIAQDQYEYPIWYAAGEGYEIENISITNESSVYTKREFVPDYIVVVGRNGEEISHYQGKEYTLYKQMGELISLWSVR